MARDINPPRGMRDFLPDEKAKREHVLRVIRRVYATHGFDEIETPMMEDIERLHSGLGGDNEKLAFSVLRRGLDAADIARAVDDPRQLADLGLRYDLTVPLSRFYATHRGELPSVFRALQIAPVWRAERPQKGRYRQFVQCDIDIIGESGLLAEVELITATAAAIAELGLADCVIRINDRRILVGLLEHCGFAPDAHARALISIDKLDKIGSTGVVAELNELGTRAAAALGEFLMKMEAGAMGGVTMDEPSVMALLPQGSDRAAIDDLVTLASSLGTLPDGVTLRFDPTLVRGMGYYTGTIFEIAHPGSGSSVAGGGRYDGMIGRFLGTDVPACGFSIGFERVIDLIEVPTEQARDAVLLIHDQVTPGGVSVEQLVGIKDGFVADGCRVRLERRTKNVRGLLERGLASGFTTFAFVSAGTTADDLVLKPLG